MTNGSYLSFQRLQIAFTPRDNLGEILLNFAP